jgi:hypothetical protein
MKWCSVIVALFLALSGAWAQGADDQYIQIYNLIQEADKLNNDLQPSDALPKYLEAQTALQRFQNGYPDWNPTVISFRLSYVATKIAALSARVPAPAAAPPGSAATNAAPPPSAGPAQVTQPAPSDWEAQLVALRAQGRQLQTDKAVLEAKLKEALSVPPAAVDPRELARAEEKVRNLPKEKDLLEIGLDQPKAKPVPAPETKALDEARPTLAEAARARQLKPLEPGQPAAAVAQLSTINYQLLLLGVALGGIVALAVAVWIRAGRRQSLGPQKPALLTAGGDEPSSYTVIVGTRSATETALANAAPSRVPQPIIHVKAPGTTQTQAEALRQRALTAEQRAERANAMIRKGLIPHLSQWLKQKLVRKLIADRAQLLETQQAVAHKVMAVEERLSRIEQQIQRQNDTYQARIEALTRELLTAKEENCELIRARITQVQAEMGATRARLMAQSEREDQASG